MVVVVLCYQRAEYLKQTLTSLMKTAHIDRYPIIVSQDGEDPVTAAAALSFPGSINLASSSSSSSSSSMQAGKIHLIRHPHIVDDPSAGATHFVAVHYKWMFDQVFVRFNFSYAVIVEEDMLLSPDFLLLFEAARPVLDADPSVWCISSWNDNGFSSFLHNNATALRRTDYFPGLGWMLRRSLWVEELAGKFPRDQWDHWMRVSTQSRHRECIFPELSRNHNIGETGSTMEADKFSHFFQSAEYSQSLHDFGDVSYLLQHNYVSSVAALVAAARQINLDDLRSLLTQPAAFAALFPPPAPPPPNNNNNSGNSNVLIIRYKNENFPAIANLLDIYQPARGTHRGLQIFTLRPRGNNNAAVVVVITANVREPDPSYLPREWREFPRPTFKPVASTRANINCAATCASLTPAMICDPTQFEFINSCDVLQQHFPCQRCSFETGADIPNFVSDSNHQNHGCCLVTNQDMTCDGAHPSTTRLCPCV